MFRWAGRSESTGVGCRLLTVPGPLAVPGRGLQRQGKGLVPAQSSQAPGGDITHTCQAETHPRQPESSAIKVLMWNLRAEGKKAISHSTGQKLLPQTPRETAGREEIASRLLTGTLGLEERAAAPSPHLAVQLSRLQG